MINNNEKKLSKLIQKILKKKTKKLRDYKYGNGSASKKIIEILKKIDFKYEKKLYYQLTKI